MIARHSPLVSQDDLILCYMMIVLLIFFAITFFPPTQITIHCPKELPT